MTVKSRSRATPLMDRPAIPRASACCCSPCAPIAGSADYNARTMRPQAPASSRNHSSLVSLWRIHLKLSSGKFCVKRTTWNCFAEIMNTRNSRLSICVPYRMNLYACATNVSNAFRCCPENHAGANRRTQPCMNPSFSPRNIFRIQRFGDIGNRSRRALA
jgi:hypothetical protein